MPTKPRNRQTSRQQRDDRRTCRSSPTAQPQAPGHLLRAPQAPAMLLDSHEHDAEWFATSRCSKTQILLRCGGSRQGEVNRAHSVAPQTMRTPTCPRGGVASGKIYRDDRRPHQQGSPPDATRAPARAEGRSRVRDDAARGRHTLTRQEQIYASVIRWTSCHMRVIDMTLMLTHPMANINSACTHDDLSRSTSAPHVMDMAMAQKALAHAASGSQASLSSQAQETRFPGSWLHRTGHSGRQWT